MAKLTAYRCDRCDEWVEETDVTHAVTLLKGKRTGRYVEDLCDPCAEKAVPSETKPAPEPTRITLPPAGPRRKQVKRNPEEVAAALRQGRDLLGEGKTLENVYAALGVSESTWKRWTRLADSLSASRSASARDMGRSEAISP